MTGSTLFRAVVLGLGTLGAFAAGRAQGQPQTPDWQLELRAPADGGCASELELKQRIKQRVGAQRKTRAGAPRVRVSILEDELTGGWIARVSALDHAGQTQGVRELRTRAETCHALDVALVLVVSAVLGVQHATAEPQPPPPEPAPPAPVVSYHVDIGPPPLQPPPPAAGPMLFSAPHSERPSEPWHIGLGLTARALSGLVPGTAAAVGAGLSAYSGWLQLVAGGLFVPAGRTRVGARAQSSFAAALGELAACAIAARPADGTVAFCAGAQAGALWGRANGLWMQQSTQEVVVLAIPSFRTQIPLSSWLSLQANLGAAFPLRAAAYSYIDETGQRRRFHGVQMGLWAELGAALRLAR